VQVRQFGGKKADGFAHFRNENATVSAPMLRKSEQISVQFLTEWFTGVGAGTGGELADGTSMT
jgi:hypothetical protein